MFTFNLVSGTHAEVGDGSGTVRGAFSYIDPRNEVRTVEYTADENGFHPQLSHPVQNTRAVDLATQRHFELYNKIALRNSDPNYVQAVPQPKNSAAVNRATQRHLELYDKIASRNSDPDYAQAVSQPKDSAAVGEYKIVLSNAARLVDVPLTFFQLTRSKSTCRCSKRLQLSTLGWAKNN